MAVLLVVTGANRGFGRSLLHEFVQGLQGPLITIIAGRNENTLTEVAKRTTELAPTAHVIRTVFDMADLESIQPAWDAALQAAASAAGSAGFRRAILINNSGSLGDICSIAELSALSSLKQTIDSNVTATIWLTALFMRWLQGPAGPSSPSPAEPPSVIINVSSLAAIRPFPTQLLYCIGKAARDMLHAGIADEIVLAETTGRLRCHVKALNYAPGPLDTDMQGELRASTTLDGGMRDMFADMHAQGKLVRPEDSAAKCLRMVVEDKYKSGAHVDYYDPFPA